ncbi:hypothetical protein IPZ58_34015 [Streptomyces roseoverticillatus]|uniref:hypothetical protein n=1 Tax=Streptomyces roseoverticillatus TaxID=66429 RepID=UPI001F2B0566|nr:hypothetical protein [Streptomyces roseoverticillatus]MCF3106547.1 hypothetical protein [Streptomyces roseoverticillatus]
MPAEFPDAEPDLCPVCMTAVEGGAAWILLSRHATRRGVVEYCLSVCGCLVVLLDGELVKAVAGRSRGGPAAARGRSRESGRFPLPSAGIRAQKGR